MSGSKRNPRSARVPAATAVPEKWRSQAGFSLAELIVSLFVVVLMMVMILLIFDSTTKLARAQTYVADVQQSVRFAQDEMVRHTRMAARGGLGRGDLPAGLVTVAVRNNVVDGSAQQDIGIGVAGSPKIMPDTDVLTVRGVFGILYHLNSDPGAATFTLDDPDNPTRGTVTVQNPVPSTGIAQSLVALKDALDAPPGGRPEALMLVSPLGGALYHIVELDKATSDDAGYPGRLVLGFKITGTVYTAAYSGLSGAPAFPAELRSVSHLGIVEEYRYYVRQILDPANPGAEAQTRLSRARFYPGTQVPWDGKAASMSVDVADNIVDLQLALAIDANGDNAIPADTANASDEWLYNAPPPSADDPNNAAWNGANKKLFYVRINTLARTARRDFQYVSEPIIRIEDHDYGPPGPIGEPAVPDPVDIARRQHRRRLLQTVIDLRNL